MDFYNYNNVCTWCYIEPLQRDPISITYSLSNGKFAFKVNETEIGIGYLTNTEQTVVDICAQSDPTLLSIIPSGVYKISKLQCNVGGNNGPRIIKLEPKIRYLLSEKYDALYNELYILPDSAEINFTLDGIKGISTNKDVRDLLTVDDVIEVVNDAPYDTVVQCAIVPQPQVGNVDIANGTQTNEIVVDFKNWGGFETMSDKMTYGGCIEIITGYCTPICNKDDTSGSGITCNSGNEKKLGTYDSNGVYTIRLMAKYKSSSFSLYSETTQDTEFSSDESSPTTLNDLQIGNITSATQLSQICSKIIVFMIYLNKVSAKRYLSAECDCNDRGQCIAYNSLTVCQCKNGFYGRSCELSKELHGILKNFTDSVIYSVENMIKTNVQLSIDTALESFGILTTVSPSVISNEALCSMISSISNLIEMNDIDELDIEHIYFVVSYLLNVIEGNIIHDSALNATKSNPYLYQISLIETIFKSLLNKKAQYKYFIGVTENVALENLNLAYYVNSAESILSSNISLKMNKSAEYMYTIEYPYEIAKTFSKPSGYSVGSNAVGISLYSSDATPSEVRIITAFDPLVMNSVGKTAKNAKELLHKWDISCGCYNNETAKFDKSVCGKVVESDGQLSCSCVGGYSPCYLVYKFPAWEVAAIVLPILISIGIALVVIVALLLMAKKRKMLVTAIEKAANDKMEKTEFK